MNVSVRWQHEMETHLTTVRQLTNEALVVPSDSPAVAPRAALAQAHATAALALAIANTGGDLEHALHALTTHLDGQGDS